MPQDKNCPNLFQQTKQSRSSQEDSLANHSLLPGSKEARQTTVGSGLKCLELYPRSGQLGLLRKMLLASSIWHSPIAYLTWKPKITKQKRLLFQLVVSVPRTVDIESSLWATPQAADSMTPKTKKGILHEILVRGRKNKKFSNLRIYPN